MSISVDDLSNWFSYHAPVPGPYKTVPLTDGSETTVTMAEAYEMIRRKAHELALVIVGLTPASADQSAAIRKLRECVMTANAAIACRGL